MAYDRHDMIHVVVAPMPLPMPLQERVEWCIARVDEQPPLDSEIVQWVVSGDFSVRHRSSLAWHAPSVAILIDEARWRFQGEKWCHMVSDVSYDELLAFTDALEIPRRAFQGDHFDIPERYRQTMIDAGAVVVESRELVRRLRSAGLRLSPTERRARTAT